MTIRRKTELTGELQFIKNKIKDGVVSQGGTFVLLSLSAKVYLSFYLPSFFFILSS